MASEFLPVQTIELGEVARMYFQVPSKTVIQTSDVSPSFGIKR